MTQTFENCTIYRSGEFFGNYIAIKCKTVTVKVTKWAQYDNALHIQYLEKGKRKVRGFIQTSRPTLVIAEGWNNPAPADMFGESETRNGVTVKKSAYSCFSPGWTADFKRDIIPQLTVLADFHGHNPQEL